MYYNKIKTLLSLLVFLLNASLYLLDSPKINIISLSNNQALIAEAYKNSFVDILEKVEQVIENKTILSKIEKCKNGTIDLYEKSLLANLSQSNSFFNIYVSTGIHRNDFGDYSLCMSVNKKENKAETKFAIVEGYSSDLVMKRMVFGICIPEKCGDLITSLQQINALIEIHEEKYRVVMFPKEEKSLNYMHVIWLHILCGYILLIIVINMLMFCFSNHVNPYDLEDIKLPQISNLTFIGPNCPCSNVVNYTNTGYTASTIKHNAYFSMEDNTPLENNNQNWFKRFCFEYLSIYNNFFLLYKTKSLIYNDSKLRFANGTLFLFSLIHVFSCIFILLQQVSKNGYRNDYFFIVFYSLISVLGDLYLEIIALLWGIIITYKFCNSVKIEDENKTIKILFWIIRHCDKLIIFVILNLVFLFSFDYLMQSYNSENILWFLYEDKIKICNWYNFLPFFDFYSLWVESDVATHCLNSNRLYFEGLYAIIFSFCILSLTLNSKHKLKNLGIALIVSLLIRCFFTSLFLKDYIERNGMIYLKPNHIIFSYLHSLFFYNLPNLILGILVGYVYFRDRKIQEIIKSKKCEYFNDIDYIRIFFYKPAVRNLFYIFSLIFILFFIGGGNFYFSHLNIFIYYPLITLNGFLCTVCISFIFLCVQLKGEEMWGLNQVIKGLSNKLIKSKIMLVFYRCMFNVNMSHVAILYVIILNLIKDPVYFDFFNVFVIFGIPVCVLILSFSFIITLFIEVPLRIWFKKNFGMKNVYKEQLNNNKDYTE